MSIDDVPIREPIAGINKVKGAWNEWFASISDALKGTWFFSKRSITSSTGEVFNCYFNERAGLVDIECEYSGSITTSNTTIELPYTVKDTYLSCYYNASGYEIKPLRVENNLILIPDIEATQLIIKGFVMKNNSWLEKGG